MYLVERIWLQGREIVLPGVPPAAPKARGRLVQPRAARQGAGWGVHATCLPSTPLVKPLPCSSYCMLSAAAALLPLSRCCVPYRHVNSIAAALLPLHQPMLTAPRCPLPSTLPLVQAAAVLEVCRSRGVPLLINDRVDVALAVGADGVHVGQVRVVRVCVVGRVGVWGQAREDPVASCLPGGPARGR